ncbi:MAG: hypothetical protein EOO39_00620 [Cytophagaceae bacterium]|nr:MAG: hypothetical protein EOO39_00620 [Cytophagaceae bacterium]
MEKEIIIVFIKGGTIQAIGPIPRNIKIIVRDYDVENPEGDNTKKDSDGDLYEEGIWEAE